MAHALPGLCDNGAADGLHLDAATRLLADAAARGPRRQTTSTALRPSPGADRAHSLMLGLSRVAQLLSDHGPGASGRRRRHRSAPRDRHHPSPRGWRRHRRRV